MNLTRFAVATAVAAAAVTATASADLVVGWTIPTAFPSGTGNVPTGNSYSVGAGDQGTGAVGSSLSSWHQLAQSGSTPTSYTSPAGNGSAYAFSSNVWKAGDYYQATFSTIGFAGVSFSWDQTRSSTGPATFEAVMSVDGGISWSTLVASYAVLQAGVAGSNTTTWNATVYQAAFTQTIQLGAAADNQNSVIVRLRALVDGVNSTGAFQAGGTTRIDNVFVNAVPAPGAVALLGLAGLVGSRRRRG